MDADNVPHMPYDTNLWRSYSFRNAWGGMSTQNEWMKSWFNLMSSKMCSSSYSSIIRESQIPGIIVETKWKTDRCVCVGPVGCACVWGGGEVRATAESNNILFFWYEWFNFEGSLNLFQLYLLALLPMIYIISSFFLPKKINISKDYQRSRPMAHL